METHLAPQQSLFDLSTALGGGKGNSPEQSPEGPPAEKPPLITGGEHPPDDPRTSLGY